jgi:hypothetical protein
LLTMLVKPCCCNCWPSVGVDVENTETMLLLPCYCCCIYPVHEP